MTGSISLPAILVFPTLMVVNGAIAFACWSIIWKNWQRIRQAELSGWQHLRARFGVLVMVLPLIVFSFGFVYWMIQTLNAI